MKKATKKTARATKPLPVKTAAPRKQVAKKNAAPAAKSTAVEVVKKKEKLTPEEEIAKRELEVATRALEVTEEAEDIARVIMSLTVDDVNRERGAVAFRTEVIKVGLKQGHDLLDDIVSSAKLTYDTARAKRDKALEPFETADKTIRDALTIYYTRQRERGLAAQRKADEEQAAREREANANRQSELRAAEDRIMDEIAKLDETAPDYQAQVDKLEAQLHPLAQPVQVVTAVKVSAPERTGAMTLQDNWKGEVIEGHEMTVLKQIVAGELPLSLVSFSAPELNRMAKLYTNKKAFDGLRFWNAPFTRGSGR
jgi:hypothetical protein